MCIRDSYAGTFKNGFLGEMSINVDIESGKLCMFHGSTGRFLLHPNGQEDEFRIEGLGALSFLHRLDLYSPSDWMMIKFTSSVTNNIDGLICSLFESGPIFQKMWLCSQQMGNTPETVLSKKKKTWGTVKKKINQVSCVATPHQITLFTSVLKPNNFVIGSYCRNAKLLRGKPFQLLTVLGSKKNR